MYQKTNERKKERKKQAILVKEREEVVEEKHVPYSGADEAMRYYWVSFYVNNSNHLEAYLNLNYTSDFRHKLLVVNIY